MTENTEKTELDLYRRNMENLLATHSDLIFQNGKIDHAVAIIETFLKRAKESVVIFCHNLKQSAYDDSRMIEALENALQRGIEVKVICQEAPESDLFRARLNAYPDHGFFVQCDPEHHAFIIGQKNNFSVMDDRAYRFEPGKEKVNAFACMNGKKTAQSLKALFDSFFRNVKATSGNV